MIGKGSFFESAIRVPLIVSVPGAAGGAVRDDLVELRDVTATMLSLAGCQQPTWMDSRPLPGVDYPTSATHQTRDAAGRELIIGMLAHGWMAYDGRWKLHKYDTGEVLLFDLNTDPEEQHNLVDEPTCRAIYRELDIALTRHVMASTTAAAQDREVGELATDEAFGREGWQRRTPLLGGD